MKTEPERERATLYQFLTIDCASVYEQHFSDGDGGWCHGGSVSLWLALRELGVAAAVAPFTAGAFPYPYGRAGVNERGIREVGGRYYQRGSADSIGGHLAVVTDDGWLLDPCITHFLVPPVCVRLDVFGPVHVDVDGFRYDYTPQGAPYKKTLRAISGHCNRPPWNVRECVKHLMKLFEREGALRSNSYPEYTVESAGERSWWWVNEISRIG